MESLHFKLLIMTQITTSRQEEWLKVLGKGMVTIPKKWREEMDITEGDIIKAKREGNKLIIEPQQAPASYRVYSDKEIEEFLTHDEDIF